MAPKATPQPTRASILYALGTAGRENLLRLLAEIDASVFHEADAKLRATDLKEAFATSSTGGRRGSVELDKLVASDDVFKTIVADQQFANRKAQMYGLAAICELLAHQTSLLIEIRNLLATEKH